MARPKKPLDAQRGDLTTKFKNERRIAEAKVSAKDAERFAEIPEELKNDDAVVAWQTWVDYFKELNFYGNVTIPELIGYCNAWAENAAAWREMKNVDTLEFEKHSALMRRIKETSEEMTRCMNRGGFSVNSRITLGEQMAREQTAEIEGQFGDI